MARNNNIGENKIRINIIIKRLIKLYCFTFFIWISLFFIILFTITYNSECVFKNLQFFLNLINVNFLNSYDINSNYYKSLVKNS